jgi:photosystem II stability/assembly factor-like uncharacterized protein
MRSSLVLALLALLVSTFAQNEAPAAEAEAGIDYDQILQVLEPRELGPTTMGGRISEIAVYEAEPRIFYIASASGGVWKTVNGGITVEPVWQRGGSIALGAVAVDQSDPDHVWIGLGEQNNRNSTSWGNGVAKSLDGGETWIKVGLEETRHIGKIVIHPDDPETVYVAALGELWDANEERGVYRTNDGGLTWQKVLYVDDVTGAVDIVMNPEDPDHLIAAMYQRERKAYRFSSGGPGSGLFASYDGGTNWNEITDGIPDTDIGRIGLDVYRKNPDIWMATIESVEGGVFRSEDGGRSWERTSGLNPRPFYFSKIRIDPNDDQRVYVLGVQMHRSVDGGNLFRTVPMRIHVDHHAMWINPEDSNHLVLGNDGGVAQSRDLGETWEHIANFPIGQYYAVTADMRKPYFVYGGLQDNGSWRGPTQTTSGGVRAQDFQQINGGDGFVVQVDPEDPEWVYTESQGGALSRLNQLTGERQFIRPSPGEGEEPYRFNWNSPIIISPHNAKTIYFAGNKLFKSVNQGDDWEVISPDLTTDDPSKQDVNGGVTPERTGAETHTTITTIAESPLEPGVLWVGTDDGLLHVTRDDGQNWSSVIDNVEGVPTNTWVSRVEPSHHELGRAYVTFDGHRDGDYNPYVYVTEDFGETWTDITNNLPFDHSTFVIQEGRENPDLLVVGTEMGVFVSLNRGESWHRYQGSQIGTDDEVTFPWVRTDDLYLHPRERDLIIGTHGRSLWIVPFAPLEHLNQGQLDQDIVLCEPAPVYLLGFTSGQWFGGNREFVSPNTQPRAYIYYYLKEEPEGQVTVELETPSGQRVAQISGSANKGLNLVTWRPNARTLQYRDRELSVKLTVGDTVLRETLTIEDLSDEPEIFDSGLN